MPRIPKLNPLQFLSADFAPKYYDSATDGAPILLIHGTFGSTASNYGLIYPGLATKFRVLGLDMQDTEDDDLVVEDLVAQAVDLIRGLELEKVHVVGYSLGAVIAAALAGMHPELVDHLVLIAGWQQPDQHLRLRSDLWHRLRATDDQALREFNVLTTFSPEFLSTLSDAQLAATTKSLRYTDFGDKQMRLNRAVDISDLTARIQAETLVLSCTRDITIPPHHQRQLAETIPHATLKHLEGGHGIVFEDADAVTGAISDFCS